PAAPLFRAGLNGTPTPPPPHPPPDPISFFSPVSPPPPPPPHPSSPLPTWAPPQATSLPSGLKAMCTSAQRTFFLRTIVFSLCVFPSYSRRRSLQLTVASTLPSGPKATTPAPRSLPLKVAFSFPVPTPHNLTIS